MLKKWFVKILWTDIPEEAQQLKMWATMGLVTGSVAGLLIGIYYLQQRLSQI